MSVSAQQVQNQSWVALVQVRREDVATVLLDKLHAVGVAARTDHLEASASPIQISVDGSKYGIAEAVVRHALPQLMMRYGEHL